MPLLQKIIDITKEAGEIVLSATNIVDAQHEKSGAYNLFTEYDVKVQQYLFEKLAQVVPDANFIGEEEEQHKTTDLSTGLHFIIDPIDGTTNFIQQYQHSSISVALVTHGKVSHGVVYNPYNGEVFSAQKGKGAYLGGTRLRTPALPLGQTLLAFGTCPYYREQYQEEMFSILGALFPHCQDLRRSGSAALDLCYVASGRNGLFFEQTLSPWDYLAGSLIITEAGGVITTLGKQPISLTQNCSILAANTVAYDEFFLLTADVLG